MMEYIIFSALIVTFYLYSNRKRTNISIELIKNFDSYIAVLTYHMEKAFDIIYKDRILVYSIEGIKNREKDIDIIARDYCSLVLKMLGQNLIEQFVILYGDKNTLIFNILDYFNTKYENDSIRQSSVDNIVSDENS